MNLKILLIINALNVIIQEGFIHIVLHALMLLHVKHALKGNVIFILMKIIFNFLVKYLKGGCVENCKTDDADGSITRHDNLWCISSC